MKRILRFDILLMSLFLIFGGSLLSAQTNTLLGKPKTKGGNPPTDFTVDCTSQNEDGQFCFKVPITFVNLDFISVYNEDIKGYINQAVFPCDLHIGLSFGGDTLYTSLSEGVDYQYFEAIPSGGGVVEGYDAHYSASINLGCFDASDFYSYVSPGLFTEEYCESLDGDPIGHVPVTLEVYCKTADGMIPVDYCKDFDLFSDIIYDSYEPENDCSLGGNFLIGICCISNSVELPDRPLTSNNNDNAMVGISFQNDEVRLNSDQISGAFYQIFDVGGVLHSSGRLDNGTNSEHFIDNLNLRDGMYILVLSGENHQSSHKFISFK